MTKELFLFSNRVKGFNFIKEIKKIAVNKRHGRNYYGR